MPNGPRARMKTCHERDHGSDGSHGLFTEWGGGKRSRACPLGSTGTGGKPRETVPVSYGRYLARQGSSTRHTWRIQGVAVVPYRMSETANVATTTLSRVRSLLRRCGGGRSLGDEIGVQPAPVDTGVDVAGLLIQRTKSHDAPERILNVTAGTAESVVQIEMAKRRVEVVAPHQADHPLAEPDAFGIGGRPLQSLAGLDRLVGARLALGLGRVGGAALRSLLLRLRLGLRLRRRRLLGGSGLLGRLLLGGLRRDRRRERERESRGTADQGDARTVERHVCTVLAGVGRKRRGGVVPPERSRITARGPWQSCDGSTYLSTNPKVGGANAAVARGHRTSAHRAPRPSDAEKPPRTAGSAPRIASAGGSTGPRGRVMRRDEAWRDGGGTLVGRRPSARGGARGNSPCVRPACRSFFC
ncbi:hypothetical protein A33M_2898 [Rhodovulum sp. PH10]|nr:hypothetical protein A33M_2898 [Rhodovulum sp. PH10]